MAAVRSAPAVGGIAGPAVAVALRRIGIQATLYEAYAEPADDVGGGHTSIPESVRRKQPYVTAATFPVGPSAVSTQFAGVDGGVQTQIQDLTPETRTKGRARRTCLLLGLTHDAARALGGRAAPCVSDVRGVSASHPVHSGPKASRGSRSSASVSSTVSSRRSSYRK